MKFRFYKKDIFSICLSCVLISDSIYGQGLVFDSTMFSKQQEFPIERSGLPIRTNLESYLPALYPQSGSTCVAMSLALARTIMLAKAAEITDKAYITRNQMSPYFIYYYSRDENDFSCEKGLNPVVALTFAKTTGFRKMAHIEHPSYWPFSNNFLCPSNTDYLPPNKDEHVANASRFKITDFYVTKSIDGIKTALSYDLPVVLGLHVPKSFENAKSTLWVPAISERGTKGANHAVVAIGYDDIKFGGSVRIVNSWGNEWGDNGKIWIKYTDLKYWMKGAFIMISETSSFESNSPFSLKNNKLPTYNYSIKNIMSNKFHFSNKEYIDAFSVGNID